MAQPDLIGQQLGGYELLEVIGSGTMATVYKAYQATLERWVAIKVLHLQANSALVRFRREAKAIALLRHRNILIIYDYGEEQGWPYLATEYVENGPLSQRLIGQPLEWSLAVYLLMPVAEALQYAHSRGIVHRDVKPSNILLPQPDWPLLADFGLVKLPQTLTKTEDVTRAGRVLGTPAYAAPEQVRGAPADHRADVYALGVILFEMVTGRLPFDYPNPNQVMLAHLSEPPPPATRFNQQVPPALDEVVQKAMAKAPHQRFDDMGQMIQAMQQLLTTTGARPPATTASLSPVQRDIRQTITIDETATDLLAAPAVHVSHPPRLLISDTQAALEVPAKDVVVIGRTHRDTVADIDLGPHGAAKYGVSRHHARLVKLRGQWHIDDLGSLNGTFVNNTRIEPGHPLGLEHGDVIRCSHLSMVFLLTD